MKLGLMLHDPEEQQDCFSNNTHNSHYYDEIGIGGIWRGRYVRADGKALEGPSLRDYAAHVDTKAAQRLDDSLAEALGRIVRIRTAADAGRMAYSQMIAAGNAEGNKMIQDAMDALVAQTRAIEGRRFRPAPPGRVQQIRSPLITRRDIVLSGAWGLAGCAVLAPLARRGARLDETRVGGRDIVLTAQERRCALGNATMPLWLYGERPFPVLRMSKGEALSVTLRNALSEHSSIHWHGVRGPNAMDGVPYLTQLPVQPGEEFAYRFTPPDAGTFFFHPHCNTATQMGRGLLGALIVDDPSETWSDDVVLLLKDWCVDGRGGFLPFLTDSGASRAGTFGALRTVNGLTEADHRPARGRPICASG